MEIDVTKEILNEIKEYTQKSLVSDMNDGGLSFGAMAVIFTAINNECDRIEGLLK